MLKVKIEVEAHSRKAAALEVEHISQLILGGYPKGEGWAIEGDPEPEPREEPLEDDSEEDHGEEIEEGADAV